MTDWGQMGGIPEGRPFDPDNRFEVDLERAVGKRLRENPEAVGPEVWSALANCTWTHDDGDTANYSFRGAGDMIAAIVGSGNYMDYYCSGPYCTVSERLAGEMKAIGWNHEPMGGEP